MPATTPDRDQAELTSYVGRTAEIEAVLRLLAVDRLVTLVGPGGVGKTRLCGRVMNKARPSFADGAAFVGLAELRDGTLTGTGTPPREGGGLPAAAACLFPCVPTVRFAAVAQRGLSCRMAIASRAPLGWAGGSGLLVGCFTSE